MDVWTRYMADLQSSIKRREARHTLRDKHLQQGVPSLLRVDKRDGLAGVRPLSGDFFGLIANTKDGNKGNRSCALKATTP